MKRVKIMALAVAAALSVARPAAGQMQAQSGGGATGENAFNPGISLILNGVYGNLSQDPAGFRIDGFVPTLGEVGPPNRGLSLGESELTFSANIDPHFRGVGIVALTPENEAEIEEAYVQTLGLSHGLTAKAGRFFSGVGYLNEIHAHAWDFTDAPLANKVFLGGQLGDDGIQVKWVAPTELYFDIGVEVGRGRQFPSGSDRNKNGSGSGNVFTHVGGDIGTSTAWQAGLSYLSTSPLDRSYEDTDSAGTPQVINSFTGRSRLWVLSGVLKWAQNHNPTYTNFKLQGEYFRRRENGDVTFDTTAVTAGGTQTSGHRSTQSGLYLQGVYQFMPQWRVGYRYDRLDAGTTNISLVDSGALTAADFPILAKYNPTRHAVMADWSGSEFSRIRLQFAQDKSRSGVTDKQVFLQYIMSLGAHGAHKF
ncbi:MAG: hypothetical protein WBO23_05485 [Burkholderiales bacterium]